MDQDDKNNKGVDLSGSLKDSSADVKFDKYRTPRPYPGTPKIIQRVIKYSGGLVKDEEQANYVLIGFVAAAIVVSLILIFGGGSNITLPRGTKIIYPQNEPPRLQEPLMPAR